jgi:hypothetical protein
LGDSQSSTIDPGRSTIDDRPASIGSRRSILTATLVALLAAALILVTAVLPAEYGIDLLGTGRLLGLTTLSEGTTGAISPQAAEYKVDTAEFVLGAYEFLEYKYRIEQGGAMVFSWEASRPVIYDFHSEPDGAPEGYAESFDKAETAQAHGTYTAPFSGIHGWFWENPGADAVTIRLTSAGFYTSAVEIRSDRSRQTRPLRAAGELK